MPLLRAFDRFFKHDASGGILLMVSAVLAMIVANSALNPYYESFLGSYLKITINDVGLSKPLILWINDGLMAVFFFL
ncbi:MAG TPA: Na(+)/H(+) antiporter NhaA, partial [Aliiroseovarius sp.]|nr:Na(+)/H(+) antiporter NhaA [Aliiroseovarius sp.]